MRKLCPKSQEQVGEGKHLKNNEKEKNSNLRPRPRASGTWDIQNLLSVTAMRPAHSLTRPARDVS